MRFSSVNFNETKHILRRWKHTGLFVAMWGNGLTFYLREKWKLCFMEISDYFSEILLLLLT